ncbi:MAG: DPP IV N-terminal domain-containing protein, partial [Draconibacterium sp.]|nr:DPP IV N-terminal domain-containing protein [Draconibacterium sp.]
MKIQKTALFILCILLISSISMVSNAQQWIKNMPGYERYTEIAPQIRGSVKSGRISADWSEDGKSFEYSFDGKKYNFDVKKKKATELGEADPPEDMYARYRRMYAGRPQRGRQYTEETSPDKTMKAIYRGGNVYITDSLGKNVIAVTTEGSIEKNFTFGTATWVYGEELGQLHAMWWSPDNKKLAYYHFDMSKVRNYYLQYEQTEIYDSMNIEAYTKVGAVNPVVELFIYDLESKKTVQVDVRDGQAFTDNVVGHYVYKIGWSPDGSELLFHRTNRKQDIMEWTAANAETGKCRVVVREEWPASFTENEPFRQFLEDEKRFIWESERNGFKNYYLYDLKEGLINPITSHEFEVAGVVKVDEKKNELWYLARSGDNHMKVQLHRCKLDGTGDVGLTDPAYNHSVQLSPDGKYFVDVAQTHNNPPSTQLVDAKGKIIEKIVDSNMSKFDELG